MRKWTMRVIFGACSVLFLAALAVWRSPEGTVAAPPPDWRVISHWVFAPAEVSKNKLADKVGQLTGTIQGQPKFQQTRQLDWLRLETPSDGILIRDKVTPSAPFLPKQAFSIVAWVRIDEPTEWGGIFSCFQDDGGLEKGLVLGYDKSKFYFGLSTTGADDGDGYMTYLTSKTAYNLGQWFHIAAVYDGKLMQIYVNGKLDNSSTRQTGDVLYADSTCFVLGRYKDPNEDYPMVGGLHEIIWSGRALTAEQIKAHYDTQPILSNQPASKAESPFLIAPYLQYATQNSITIMCETNTPTNCVVEYGTTFPPKQQAKSPTANKLHEIPLTGLVGKTKYFYRVRCTTADGESFTSPNSTFMTAVDSSDAYSFTVIGDTQRNPVVTAKIAKLMWERRPNFVLHMGDVVDNGPDLTQWTDDLFKSCQELFSRVPIYPTIGNHEKNHAYYYQYFSLPKPEYYYSFKYGNAEFFAIDTNKSVLPGSEQYRWLDSALAASKAKWKICYHHHPCYSSDNDDYGDTEKVNSSYGSPLHKTLIPLYEKHNVDISMNGHIHLYERTWPIRGGKVSPKDGVIYLTSGGGGARLENFEPTPAFFKNQGRVDYHYCYFTVYGGQLECKVFDVEGRLFDQFSLTKP